MQPKKAPLFIFVRTHSGSNIRVLKLAQLLNALTSIWLTFFGIVTLVKEEASWSKDCGIELRFGGRIISSKLLQLMKTLMPNCVIFVDAEKFKRFTLEPWKALLPTVRRFGPNVISKSFKGAIEKQ